MPQTIHIPKDNGRVSGPFLPVSINNVLTLIPIGKDFFASDEQVAVLLNANIPIAKMPESGPPDGFFMVPTSYGARVVVGLNGTVTYIPTATAIPLSSPLLSLLEEGSVQIVRGTGTGGTTPGSPYLMISASQSKPEGNGGSTSYTFDLTLIRNGFAGDVPYNYTTAGFGPNPASGSDFSTGAFPFGSGSFTGGGTQQQIVVTVLGDAAAELDESFLLTVTGPNVVTATGTITNDDSGPAFGINPSINGTPTVGVAMSFSDGSPPAGWTITKRELIDSTTGAVLAVENV